MFLFGFEFSDRTGTKRVRERVPGTVLTVNTVLLVTAKYCISKPLTAVEEEGRS